MIETNTEGDPAKKLDEKPKAPPSQAASKPSPMPQVNYGDTPGERFTNPDFWWDFLLSEGGFSPDPNIISVSKGDNPATWFVAGGASALKYSKSFSSSLQLQKLTGVAKSSSQILSWGRNSVGHLIKHRDVLGFGSVSPQQAQKMVPQLRAAVNQLFNNANPALTRVGRWHDYPNALMYISEGKMIVTEANGTFITVINKTSNQWYNAAKPLVR